jgi:hypothetical protein
MNVKYYSKPLPEEIQPEISWRRIAIILFLSFILLFITNLFAFTYLGSYSTNFGYWSIHQKWKMLGKINRPVDWVILGDSSCSQGIMPAVFSTELNQIAVNFCTIGDMGTVGDLWMLEEYIQRVGAPKNVLVVHTFDIWYREFNPVRLGQIPRPWGFWQAHSFGEDFMQEKEVRNGIFLERYVPLYSQRGTIGRIIRNTLAGNHNPLKAMWINEPDGFVPAIEPKPLIVEDGEKQMVDFVNQNTFSVSQINDQALRKMLEVADLNDIKLVIANAPIYEGLFSNASYQGYFQSLQSYLQGAAAKYDHTQYVSSVKTFPADQMQTPDHLIVPGAEEYTHWLIGEILKLRN